MNEAYELFLKTFNGYTEIQKVALPIVKSGENCIITASPGSGKTEAALLPIFSKLCEKKVQGVYALYITPLRALNRDLQKRLEYFGKELGVSVETRHGDTKQSARTRQALSPPNILITTPESLQSILTTKKLYQSMKGLRVVIVDEVHELYYNKRGAQLAVALERLVEVAGEFQRIGISATIGDVSSASVFLCGKRQCRIIRANTEKQMQVVVETPTRSKKEYKSFSETFSLDKGSMARIERIANLVKDSKATLIFANTRQIVESLGNKLINFDKIEPFGSISVHHSSLDREERITTENSFKEGKVRSIIATSSLELGIDIGKVDLVIQYGSPRQVTRLVQRVGRSGHTEKSVSIGKIIVANTIDALESTAIVSLARQKELEKRSVEKNPYDVLLNQLCATLMEYKQFEVSFFYKMLKRSSVYADLTEGELEKVLSFAEKQHLVRLRDGKIGMGGRSRSYFIENISVIPDSQRFLIRNVSSNRPISTLDENFVSNYIEDGSTFISKGLAWKVISIEERNIFVEPSTDIDAAIPDWEGEDIPVARAVAEKALSLLDRVEVERANEYVTSETKEAILGLIEKQKAYEIPRKGVIFCEVLEDRAVIFTALGKLGNDLLARVIGAITAANVGTNISTRSNAYTIIIDFSGASRRPDLKKIFGVFETYDIRSLLKNSNFILSSELFRYKFVQIAKLFGVIEKKAIVTRNVTNKLIGFYKDSPVFEEAIRDLTKNYFDVEAVLELQKALKEKSSKLIISESDGSPLTREILRYAYFYKELLIPLQPNSQEVEQFVEGIMDKSSELICTYCGFRFSKKPSEYKEQERVLCISCKSPMVAVYEEGYENVVEKKKIGTRLRKSESALYADMIANASLVDAYGVRALVAFATYGIGFTSAARSLKMLRTDFKLFVIDLINAQKQFIKNRKFWKAR